MDFFEQKIMEAERLAVANGYASLEDAFSKLIGQETKGAEHNAINQPSQ